MNIGLLLNNVRKCIIIWFNLYYIKNVCIYMYIIGVINFFLFMMILCNELMNMILLL